MDLYRKVKKNVERIARRSGRGWTKRLWLRESYEVRGNERRCRNEVRGKMRKYMEMRKRTDVLIRWEFGFSSAILKRF